MWYTYNKNLQWKSLSLIKSTLIHKFKQILFFFRIIQHAKNSFLKKILRLSFKLIYAK